MRAPGPSDNPLRFSSARVSPYAGRLLPVCCPMRSPSPGDQDLEASAGPTRTLTLPPSFITQAGAAILTIGR
jgi:hypothetical protein